MAVVLTGKMPVLRETAFFNGLLGHNNWARIHRVRDGECDAACRAPRGVSIPELARLSRYSEGSMPVIFLNSLENTW